MLWLKLPYTGSAAQVPTHAGPLRFDRAPFIAKCHSLGLRIDFWTIDDPAEAARLIALGADGIMTNDPRTIRPIVHAASAGRAT
jgi:glycerophosphoryl diester phosphodiesterase